MPRPRPGYVRPSSVRCIICDGPVEVAPVGRIPDGHAACIQFAQDCARVFASVEEALHGRTPDEVRALHRYWSGRITSDGNTLWNRYDNPARRAAAARRAATG